MVGPIAERLLHLIRPSIFVSTCTPHRLSLFMKSRRVLPKIEIGLTSDTLGGPGSKISVRAPLSTFQREEHGAWTHLSLFLDRFPTVGHFWDAEAKVEREIPMDWSMIKEFRISFVAWIPSGGTG